MGLLDSLRRAEEQGRRVSQRSGEIWEDAQRRIRRKMRIHPSGLPARAINPRAGPENTPPRGAPEEHPSRADAASSSSVAADDIYKPVA